jgi:hypothetical protein
MRSTLQEPVPPYIGVDLTDRYSRNCRPSDVCGLRRNGNDTFTASFWLWQWDAAPKMLDVTSIVMELTAARAAMFDGLRDSPLPVMRFALVKRSRTVWAKQDTCDRG